MQKDFDLWNVRKKDIDEHNLRRLYHKREVWWCSLGVNVGFEQDGAGATKERPVLILKGFSKEVCLVLPLTTSKKKNPYHVSLGGVGGRESFAIISQLRLIDTKRLINKIGVVEKKLFEEIRKVVKDLL